MPGTGVEIDSGATNNTIGGTTPAAGNLITNHGRASVDDNGAAGVVIVGNVSSGNVVTANQVFGNTEQDIGVVGTGGPAVVLAADSAGQLQGWLHGAQPDQPYRIDVYASAGFEGGEYGEAQDWLGSFEVTTDASGQATFDVPYAAPAGLGILTATATAADLEQNTSALPTVRQVTLEAPTGAIQEAPGLPLDFSSSPGDTIAILDPDVGPLSPAWDVTVSVSAGTLTLSTTAGLTGTGDGTATLSGIGTATAIDAALAGMIFTPPPGYQGAVTLSIEASSMGAARRSRPKSRSR